MRAVYFLAAILLTAMVSLEIVREAVVRFKTPLVTALSKLLTAALSEFWAFSTSPDSTSVRTRLMWVRTVDRKYRFPNARFAV